MASTLRVMSLLDGAGCSLRTLQRLKRNYRLEGLKGLSPKKRGHRPKIELEDAIKEKIKEYRERYRWGSEVIQAHLRLDHGCVLNRYRIDRFLKDSGLRKEYPCTTIKKVKIKRKRHTKKVVVRTPGKHTQMDVKYQLYLLRNKSKAFVYNFIDHASNWSFKRAYSRISAKNTLDFMERLLKVCPFKIERLQTDNGVEFTFKWTSQHPDDPKAHPLVYICDRESINHKLIPPGEKELQGLVERAHRQDDQELYSRINPWDLEEFNLALEEHYRWRNRGRRFKKIQWLSPDLWLKDNLGKEPAVEVTSHSAIKQPE